MLVHKCIIVTSDNKIIVCGNYVVDGNWDIYLWKMNSNLEDDTLYTQPITYDSLCPLPNFIGYSGFGLQFVR